MDYATLGILQCWRFDEAGRRREIRLAGDRLVEGLLRIPIAIEELAGGVLQDYSAELNLYLCWEQGQLRLSDPATGRHILTYDYQRACAERGPHPQAGSGKPAATRRVNAPHSSMEPIAKPLSCAGVPAR